MTSSGRRAAKAQALVTAGTAEGGTMQYSTDGTSYSPTIPTGTDVGTYTVWYRWWATTTTTIPSR